MFEMKNKAGGWLRSCGDADPILLPFLQAEDERESHEFLECLIRQHAEPVIRTAIRFKFSSQSDWQLLNQKCEDLVNSAIVRLLTELRGIKNNPSREAPRDFKSYVARVAASTWADYLRELYPQMRRLQDQLRYWFTHNPKLEIWLSDQGVRVCGYKVWRQQGKPNVNHDSWRQVEQKLGLRSCSNPESAKEQQRQLTAFVEEVLVAASAPVEFAALTRLAANWLGINRQNTFTEGQNVNDDLASANPVFEIEQRLYLAQVWECVANLSLSQRRALLLNLRSGSDRGLIVSLCDLKIATIPQLATLIEMPIEEFLRLWGRLPIDDEDIAALFEMTRQQVVNQRAAARTKLAKLLSV